MIVLLIDEHGERTMFPSRGANAVRTTSIPAWVEDLEVLHVTAYSFEQGPTVEAVLRAVERQHERGGLVSFDVSSTGLIRHYGVDAFVELVRSRPCRPDFLSANEDECETLDLVEGPAGPVRGCAQFPEPSSLRAGARMRRR